MEEDADIKVKWQETKTAKSTEKNMNNQPLPQVRPTSTSMERGIISSWDTQLTRVTKRTKTTTTLDKKEEGCFQFSVFTNHGNWVGAHCP